MRVLVACGGTGGHIFPALSFIERLKSKCNDLDIRVVLVRRKIETKIVPHNYKIVYINLSPVSLKFNHKNIIAVLKLFLGTVQSLYIILRFSPQAIVGFGGYATFPLVFFGRALGIKTIIHEQNVALGRANKLLAAFVDRIAISFQESRTHLKPYSQKIILTGNPRCLGLSNIDKSKALDFFGFLDNRFTILVMGGSQGSSKINNVFLKVLLNIQDKSNLQVIHLSGFSDFGYLLDQYEKMNINFRLFDFLKGMPYAYCASDLGISRSGATTVGEIIFYGLPVILVPYPFAYHHQMANARLLTDRGAAILIEDKDFNASNLSNSIACLLRERSKIEQLRTNLEYFRSIPIEEDLSDLALHMLG